MKRRVYINRGLIAGTMMSLIGVSVVAVMLGQNYHIFDLPGLAMHLVFFTLSILCHTTLLRHSLDRPRFLWWRIIGCSYGLALLLGLLWIIMTTLTDYLVSDDSVSIIDMLQSWISWCVVASFVAIPLSLLFGTYYYYLLHKWRDLYFTVHEDMLITGPV